ncbi:hypothetical protein D477_009158 [Arthrobacter crystallopoietes BAB-32]|uniref:SGNH hydrolase-type esterase domain-containing protein n=1 Tax=Arthrobacter crystallopoietes BAB-32 TaxID=1246476 RepID=N1V3G5_9MICC|nr:SGNH/GDSL hydrolase family protein [Arthrobacter crystallopoietes]EMY34564.1 hypothetical protein D477_009158 [Arthrobacter crystallopoietes BAB-32]
MTSFTFGRKGHAKRFGAVSFLVAGLIGGSAVAPASAHSETVDLVVLGDSYSAGIGTGELAAKAQGCFASGPGYAEYLEERPGVALDGNFACAGATAKHAMQQAAAAYGSGALGAQTDLVTVTAGGNDVDFSAVILACATQPAAVCQTAVDNGYETARAQVLPDLQKLYGQLGAAAPDATIAAVGYPHLFSTKAGSASPLSPEAAEIFNEGVDRLNGVIEEAADRSPQAVYVDVTERFERHGIGSPAPWLNYGSADSYRDFHPTVEGYKKGYAGELKQLVGDLRR